MKYISEEILKRSLSVEDLSKRDGHVINMIVSSLQRELSLNYKLPLEIYRGDSIVNKKDNYENLGYGNHEVTLSERYTRYLDDKRVLRTQMTALMPKLLEEYKNKPIDKVYLLPGLVYRRDVVDRTHVAEPHQMDIWLLKEGLCNRDDLLELVKLIISWMEKVLEQKIKYRLNNTSHHYTDEGWELEILHGGEWLEILECGLAGKKLLETHGIDSSKYGGLALGMGLDRLAMIIKSIEDIRVLRSVDVRVAKQMENYEKYKPVSNQPPIKRDLSIALDQNIKWEWITEKIMNLLSSEERGWIEEINLIEKTDYKELPLVAKERLGIKDNQSNYLISLVLRHPVRTISRKEANKIYQEVYRKIHDGSRGYI